MLFQKMREEQVKKWHIREEEILRKEKTAPPRPATKPKVIVYIYGYSRFLLGGVS